MSIGVVRGTHEIRGAGRILRPDYDERGMIPCISIAVTDPVRPPALLIVRRYLLTLAVAVVLAAVTVDRGGRVVESAPIVLTTTYDPPRFGRARPYRAHYRRGARA